MGPGVIRMPEGVWTAVHTHLFATPGEHFAFLRARVSRSGGAPVFLVYDAMLIPDDCVTITETGWELSTEALIEVINAAVRAGDALIEVHNHGGHTPRFSPTDRKGLRDFPTYVCDSLPGRPYGATVWGDSTVYGEYFMADGTAGVIGSITVLGSRLRQIVSLDDDLAAVPTAFDRQLPWFSTEGQRQMGRLRVAIVGAGGTGSQLVQNLVYLGIRDFLIIEHDQADDTNQNRLVTSTAADLETPKAILARRLIRSVAPTARARVIEAELQTDEALDAIKGVDVIFGCIDNDGARLVLNEIALAYGIPLFDLGVGIDVVEGRVECAGGRVAVVAPAGPCLHCMNVIDIGEAAYHLSSSEQRAFQVERGYVSGVDVPAPAVVSLNAAVAAMAANEFAVLLSGLRPVCSFTEIDLLGTGRSVESQWATPRRVEIDSRCVPCNVKGSGDATAIERYRRG